MASDYETKTITTSPDGTTTVVSEEGSYPGHFDDNDQLDGGSFFAGVAVTMLLLGVAKAWKSLRGRRPADADAAANELAALRQRTATLERIVTDPAARVAHEIEALR